jgi:CheY-like chemotaxis protein
MGRILIIDDEASARTVIRTGLEVDKHEVREAINGQEGLDLFREDPVDIVIVDMVMPGKGGLEVIDELRQNYPDVKIISISGQSIADLNRSPARGADLAIGKPIDIWNLLKIVKMMLGEEA